jgi:phage shock protein A
VEHAESKEKYENQIHVLESSVQELKQENVYSSEELNKLKLILEELKEENKCMHLQINFQT